MKEKLVELKQKAVNKAYETGWYGQRPVRDIEENHIADTSKKVRNWTQEALSTVDDYENMGLYCEALREFVYQLEAAGYDPEKHTLDLTEDGLLTFNPEMIVEGLPAETLQ